MAMTPEEHNKVISIFREMFGMYADASELTLDVYFEMSEGKAIPNTQKTIKCYSVALWMAYLMSMQEYNRDADVKDIGKTSKTMGDRSDSFVQGNNLTNIRRDPRGFLAQYEALTDQYASNNKGMFFMSVGTGIGRP